MGLLVSLPTVSENFFALYYSLQGFFLGLACTFLAIAIVMTKSMLVYSFFLAILCKSQFSRTF